MICELIYRDEFLIDNGHHPLDSLFYVIDGSFTCEISGQNYNVSSGMLFAFPSKVNFKRKITKPIQAIYIQFKKYPIDIEAGIIQVADKERLSNDISYIFSSLNAEENAEYFVNDLLVTINLKKAKTRHLDKNIADCIDFINQNINKKISLENLSQHTGVSKQTLIGKFKKQLSITPTKYINQIKIKKGCEMLRLTDKPVGEISDICGFENVYYFSRTFKLHTGFSPTVYRASFKI